MLLPLIGRQINRFHISIGQFECGCFVSNLEQHVVLLERSEGGLLWAILAEGIADDYCGRRLLFRLFSGNFFRNLDETFVLLDHPQLKAGTLFNRIVTLFQITDLGIEARIPDFQRARDFLLLLQLTVVLPNLQPAPLTHPERVLEQADDCEEADRQPTHQTLAQVVESFATGIGGGIAEIFLDPQQLVVLGDTVGTGQRTGLDLAGIEANGDIGDGAVFGFTGAMRDHRGVASALGHFNGSKGFGQGTDLVDLDQDGIADALLDTFLEDLGIGDENVVANDLHGLAQGAR
jgi:hypothetical protein